VSRWDVKLTATAIPARLQARPCGDGADRWGHVPGPDAPVVRLINEDEQPWAACRRSPAGPLRQDSLRRSAEALEVVSKAPGGRQQTD
jgi:hypothetical protein